MISKCSLGKNYLDVFVSAGISLLDTEKKWRASHGLEIREISVSRNYRSIRGETKALVYNAFYGGAATVGVGVDTVMNAIREGLTLPELFDRVSKEELVPILRALFRKKLLVYGEESNSAYCHLDSNRNAEGALINKLRLNLTKSCNMKCTYCYIAKPEKESHMDWEVAKKSIEVFCNNLRKHKRKKGLIRFFGGEPLLNWKVLRKCLLHAKSEFPDLSLSFFLNTNGTLIKEEKAQFLKEFSVHVAVSLDGIGEINDQNRVYSSGRGTFLKVDKAINTLLEEGVSTGIEVTLTEDNYPFLEDVIHYIHEKNTLYDSCVSVGLQSACFEGISLNKAPTPASWKAQRITEIIRLSASLSVDVSSGMVMFPWNTLISGERLGVYCGAIGGEVSVSPQGDLTPCAALETKMGTISNFEEALKSREYQNVVNRVVGNISACSGCDIEAFCSGGCVADAHTSSGDVFKTTQNCAIEKAVFHALAVEYIS